MARKRRPANVGEVAAGRTNGPAADWPFTAGRTRALAFVVVLAVAAYANAIGNGFSLDDVSIIVENPVIRNAGDIHGVFTSGYWPRVGGAAAPDPTLYRPLTIFTYAVDFAVWGLRAPAFHAVNVGLHAVTTALVFLLAIGVAGSLAAALAAASIFAVHPLHTEAVSGVVGRAEILATLFFLLSFLTLRRRSAFRSGAEQGRTGSTLVAQSIGAAALWLLGLFAKESAATLPLVLALDDWLHRSDFPSDRKSILRILGIRYAALVLAAFVYLLLRLNAVSGLAQTWPGWVGVTAPSRILTACRVVMEYIGLFVFPGRLLADYWKTEVPIAATLADPGLLLALALWIGCGALAFWSFKRERRLVLPLAWFFITIAPVSNILFPIGVAKAERLTYLPSVGLCLLAGWAFARAGLGVKMRWAPRLVLVAILVALTARTVRRNQDWKDSLTLALATLRVSPASPLMNDIAAGELYRRGEAQRALPLLQTAAEQAPNMAFVRTHLGSVYAALGMLDQAIAEYGVALRINPSDAEAHNNLGVIYLQRQRADGAFTEFRAAIDIKPGYVDAHMNLGVVHLEQGRMGDALAEFSEAVRLNPGSAETHYNLGVALLRTGQLDSAAARFRESLRLDPGHEKARATLAQLEEERTSGVGPAKR